MDNKDFKYIDRKSIKKESKSEISFKNIPPQIEFIFLKENLLPKDQRTLSSASRNSVKIFFGKDKKSVSKIIKTVSSLTQKNAKLVKFSRVNDKIYFRNSKLRQ